MRADKFKDELMNSKLHDVETASMAIITALQGYKPPVQVLSLGFVFAAYAESTGQNIPDIFQAAQNASNSAGNPRPEFMAVRDYLKQEVLDRD